MVICHSSFIISHISIYGSFVLVEQTNTNGKSVISGSHGGEYEDGYLLGCSAV
jgi:hypothetical protein